jgi:hypothetical protein
MEPRDREVALISGEPWKLGSKFFMEILQPRRITFKPIINEISMPNRVAWTDRAPGFGGYALARIHRTTGRNHAGENVGRILRFRNVVLFNGH